MPKPVLPFPLIISSGAVYPFSEELLARGELVSPYKENYNLFRVVGSGPAARIWVPRSLAPSHGGQDKRVEGLGVSFSSSFVPRNEEQARVVKEASRLLSLGYNFVAECPTGFGKTVCAMQIIANVGKKTLVVVTKEDLRDQWVSAATTFLGLSKEDIGFIQGGLFQVSGKKLVIAMIQSLAKESRHSMAGLDEFGMVVFDEVHRVAADYFSQACFRVPAKLRLGLSATTYRKDGRWGVVEAHIGEVMVSSKAMPMIPRIVARESPWKIPLTSVLDKKENKRVMVPIPHSPGRCGHIINLLCKNHARNDLIARFAIAAFNSGRVTLIQSDRKDHLETIALLIQSLGVHQSNFGSYLGGMKAVDLEETKSKKIIMATYQMTSEGTDVPWIDTLIMATPRSDVCQIVGRILRTYEGKKGPLVLDIIDSSSPVFLGYWKSRKNWYKTINAKINETLAPKL